MRVETQLVSVPAVITNSSGRPLAGLRRENFQVFEDGQLQSIANFGTTQTPFEIALLFDTSGSTRADVGSDPPGGKYLHQRLAPRATALRSSPSIRSSNGSTQIAAVDVLSQLTGDRKLLEKAIENLGSANGTPFYDALDRIVQDVFREPAPEDVRGRRAVVALTDGVDSTSDTDFAVAEGKADPIWRRVLFHSGQHRRFRGRSFTERLPG